MKGLVVNRKKFWHLYDLHFPEYRTQGHVDGLNYLLDRFETETRLKNIPQFSYCLATAYHESGKFVTVTINGKSRRVMQRFVPVRESKGSPASNVWIKYQCKYWDTGYYGRGLIQVTLEPNYLKVGKLLGVGDYFVKNPDALLQKSYSYDAMVVGMVLGIYRADKLKKRYTLERFLSKDKAEYRDYYLSRQIVNGDMEIIRDGMSMGDQLASIATHFDAILRDSQISNTETLLLSHEDSLAAELLQDETDQISLEISNPVSESRTEDTQNDASLDLSSSASATNATSSVQPPVKMSIEEEHQTSAGKIETKVETPLGDTPETKPRWMQRVEDWKPWCVTQAKRVIKWTTGLNTATFPTFTGLGITLGGSDYWWIGLALAIVLVIATVSIALLVLLAIGIRFLWNSWQISNQIRDFTKAIKDPNSYNYALEFEHKDVVKTGGLFGRYSLTERLSVKQPIDVL